MDFTKQSDRSDRQGIDVRGVDPSTLSDEDVDMIIKAVHVERVVVLKEQDLSPTDFVQLGRRFGRLVPYHEPMYHHPDEPDIFVSSTVEEADGSRVGVPKTGKFWHSDYQFMAEPFAFTLFAPQVLPARNRGTFFVDMSEAWASLPDDLRSAARGRRAFHSVRRYFKIRPEDVYRPLGEIIDEVERKNPPAEFPLVFEHPVTGDEVLYLSQGFTVGLDDDAPAWLLPALLEHSGQLDDTFEHPLIRRHTYDPGDVVIWDNRTLVHRALHTTTDEPSVSWRLTALDGHPLYRRAV